MQPSASVWLVYRRTQLIEGFVETRVQIQYVRCFRLSGDHFAKLYDGESRIPGPMNVTEHRPIDCTQNCP